MAVMAAASVLPRIGRAIRQPALLLRTDISISSPEKTRGQRSHPGAPTDNLEITP
jgi:hypothetical protein